MSDKYVKNINYDRIDDDPENGQRYYGRDLDGGKTIWFDADGNQDCITDTPSDYDDNSYQHRIDDADRVGNYNMHSSGSGYTGDPTLQKISRKIDNFLNSIFR